MYVILKRIYSSDVNLVVPDNYWTTDTAYAQFNSDEEMYNHETKVQLTGNVDYSSGSVTITGNSNSTYFFTEITLGDIVEFPGLSANETRVRRQIVDLANDVSATINTSIATSYTANVISKISASYPQYAKNFYVRNSYDQVFICIFNNGDSKSTVEPVITPANFSIGKLIDDTVDGYIWRYLYTIPTGLKEKFYFTDSDGVTWIPVTTDTIVSTSAVDGAIEHIRVLNSGSGYNSNTPNSAADIITVTGDGSDALFVANVINSPAIDSTSIGSVLSANAGSGYTYATVTASGGVGANLSALISPVGGFGYDPAKDLGAKFLGISVEFAGNISGLFPVSTDSGNVVFRQISVVRNPEYSNGNFVSTASVAMTSNVQVSTGTVPPVGGSFVQASGFTGDVVGYTTGHIILNNTKGTFSNTSNSSYTVDGGYSGIGLDIVTSGVKRSGEVLYVENIEAVERNSTQYEQVKLVLKF